MTHFLDLLSQRALSPRSDQYRYLCNRTDGPIAYTRSVCNACILYLAHTDSCIYARFTICGTRTHRFRWLPGTPPGDLRVCKNGGFWDLECSELDQTSSNIRLRKQHPVQKHSNVINIWYKNTPTSSHLCSDDAAGHVHQPTALVLCHSNMSHCALRCTHTPLHIDARTSQGRAVTALYCGHKSLVIYGRIIVI